jgi:cytochrome c oxidase assembly protein subunit 15
VSTDLSRWLRPLAWATLVANIGLVVTGGAVRLTDSGLGCPTWPRCHGGSFTPHGALSVHAGIEFGNRMLTFVLTAIAIATFVAAWQSRRRDLRVLALVIALGIPAQALIGGITVLTDLNPWLVSLHLLCSMAIIGLAVLFIRRVDEPAPVETSSPGASVLIAWLTFGAGWLVLYLGTVVTGSGPHAGDADSPRNGLSPAQLSQAHADAVFLFIGLTVALVVLTRTTAAYVLLGVEVAQGVVGYVQYFTDLPVVLVGVHMLGAALISAAVTWALLETREYRVRPAELA